MHGDLAGANQLKKLGADHGSLEDGRRRGLRARWLESSRLLTKDAGSACSLGRAERFRMICRPGRSLRNRIGPDRPSAWHRWGSVMSNFSQGSAPPHVACFYISSHE